MGWVAAEQVAEISVYKRTTRARLPQFHHIFSSLGLCIFCERIYIFYFQVAVPGFLLCAAAAAATNFFCFCFCFSVRCWRGGSGLALQGTRILAAAFDFQRLRFIAWKTKHQGGGSSAYFVASA